MHPGAAVLGLNYLGITSPLTNTLSSPPPSPFHLPRDAVAEDNPDKIKAASEDLSKEAMQMGAAVYQQGGAAGGAAGAAAGGAGAGPQQPGAGAGPSSSSSGSSGGGDDNVIDAEFTDKK
jgi:molecular chaperone DnaK